MFASTTVHYQKTEITLLYNSYNPKIVMKTSLPKIKLYGGDKEIKKNGFIRVDKNINNSIYFDNPESNLYGKTYFYVMQYQARNNGGVPTSTGNGLPWTNISQLDAIQKSKDAGYHLITNWEWMAIARDIEQVPENWTGGAVGSGMIKRGNVGITDDGSYDGANPETGILNDKAKLKLSNGEEIYHFSGNVWEWVDDTITQGEQYINFNQNASNWYEFNATDLFKVAQKLPYTEVGPKETYATPSSNGLGRIYINTSNGSSANRAFLRGGAWGNGADAGVFALDLGNFAYGHAHAPWVSVCPVW
jgi:formylglycine-generating enzyme required for sulfatase activity